jgi:hypothetical protein
MSDASEPPSPTLRAVLLGASNLHYGIRFLVAELARRRGAPVEALAAGGRGRSYGTWSKFMHVRRLPGILNSPLWSAVAARPQHPTLGLITDVGNDIMYGAAVEDIVRWVEGCLDRLEAAGARTVLTLPCLARIERVTPAQFYFFRSLFFPGRFPSWTGTLQRSRALQAELVALAARRGVTTVEPRLDWYGLDPIHHRRDRREEVWGAVLDAWGIAAGSPSPGPLGRPRGFRISDQTRLFGWHLAWKQPALRWPDGSRLSFF